MKKKQHLFLLAAITGIAMLAGCGSEHTPADKTASPVEQSITTTPKPSITMVLDGRKIESTDYSCMWLLKDKQNILNVTVHYDRRPKRIPPNIGFNVYNLKDIKLPINRVRGIDLSPAAGQIYSLGGLMVEDVKVMDLNKLSFTDNYPTASSLVKITLLDTTAKLLSGSFEGVLLNANGTTLKVTEGKMDRIPLTLFYK